MSFNANKLPVANGAKKSAPPLDPGAYPARLVSLVLMGMQKERPFKGEEKPPRLKMRMTYELLDEFLKDDDGKDLLDKPRWLTQEVPFLSLKADRATSTKIYYALDPNEKYGGDFSKLIGSPCMITVVVEKDKRPGVDKVYEKIASVSSMRDKEAAKAPPLVNEPYLFDFYEPNLDVYDKLPEWLQDRIREAIDFEDSVLQKALSKAGKTSTKKVKEEELETEEKEELDDEIPW